MNEQQLAHGLGWFSIGLGAAEVLAPEQVGRAVGVSNHHDLIRAMGVREIASGIGILSHDRPPAGWLWWRLAGDLLDLGLLGAAAKTDGTDRRRLTGALLAVAGVAALDALCSLRLSEDGRRRHGTEWHDGTGRRLYPARQQDRPVRKSIVIDRPREEVYQFWRYFENLPRFMSHLKSVTMSEDGRSHWVAKGPAGTEVEWDAEVTKEIPNELIAWRSLPGASVENSGTVRFERATGDRGTLVRVELEYRPPGGVVGATIAKLFGEAPEKQIPVDLMRVKQLLETGEIARTGGQPAGRARSTSRKYDDFVRA